MYVYVYFSLSASVSISSHREHGMRTAHCSSPSVCCKPNHTSPLSTWWDTHYMFQKYQKSPAPATFPQVDTNSFLKRMVDGLEDTFGRKPEPAFFMVFIPKYQHCVVFSAPDYSKFVVFRHLTPNMCFRYLTPDFKFLGTRP